MKAMIQTTRIYLNRRGMGPLIVRAVIGSGGLRLAGMVFGFLVGLQLTRGLGVDDYGIYGVAMSVIALLTVPTEFGLPQLLTREVAAAQVSKDWAQLRGILMWSSKVVILASVCVMTLVAIGFAATDTNFCSPLAMPLIAGLVMVPLVALGNLQCAALRGLQHIVKGQLPDTLIRPALFSLFLFLAPWLAMPLSPALAMWLGVASAAVAFGLAIFLLHRHLPAAIRTAKPKFHPVLWWSSAMPMALTEGMRVLQSHFLILLMSIFATISMVGLFKVASSVALLITVPVALLNVVGAPLLSRLHAQGDHVRLQRLLRWIAIGMTGGSLALTVPLLVDGRSLLAAVFGEEFGAANESTLVLCGSAVINGIFGANAVLLNMTGHQNRVTRASGFSLVLLVLLSPPLIANAGALGAAIASSLSMLAWNVMMWRDALRLLSIDTSLLYIFRTP